jgi:hypothetical protein
METLRASLKAWLPLAVVLTVVLGMVYVVAQQVLRQSANDPQIQLAEDWADQVSSGRSPTQIAMGAFIDPTHSLASFGIIYNSDGSIANSSISAPSTMLQADGVFGDVDRAANHELRFTWQPANDSRFATVIKRTTMGSNTYYVLAARNLREVENREDMFESIIFFAWLVGLFLTYGALHVHTAVRIVRRRKK